MQVPKRLLLLILLTVAAFAWVALTRPQTTKREFPTSSPDHPFELAKPDTVKGNSLSGRELFLKSCATCHGADGTGAPQTQLGFATRPADFTNCNFATREPNADWIAVAHEGGAIRGFADDMPAFGDALTGQQLEKIMNYIRTLCTEDDWPRGELNLPKPLYTTKAYPEDEAVLSSTVNAEDRGAITNQLLYEQRIGARGMFEVAVPFGYREMPNGNWTGGHLGDIALGGKYVLYDNLSSGSILSLGGEVLLPSGSEANGFGSGTTVIEPYLTYGKILPAGFFGHLQTGGGIPLLQDKASNEVFGRGVLGKTFVPSQWGRTWSPMVEVLGSQELESGAPVHWNIVPQMQVSLNQRQHLRLNIGASVPLDDPSRTTQLRVYLLWDWFDGGLSEGW